MSVAGALPIALSSENRHAVTYRTSMDDIPRLALHPEQYDASTLDLPSLFPQILEKLVLPYFNPASSVQSDLAGASSSQEPWRHASVDGAPIVDILCFSLTRIEVSLIGAPASLLVLSIVAFVFAGGGN